MTTGSSIFGSGRRWCFFFVEFYIEKKYNASAFVEYALNDQVSFGIEMFAEDVTTPENLNVQQSGSGEQWKC